MNNNDIFKKLRVALQLRDDQIVEIMELVDFRISKAELSAFFRNEDHPNFMECGDQVLRNFLNGLVIHLRGTKENPKNPTEVLKGIAKSKIELNPDKKPDAKKPFAKSFPKKNTESSGQTSKKKPFNPKAKSNAPKKIEVVEKVKYNLGKQKKK